MKNIGEERTLEKAVILQETKKAKSTLGQKDILFSNERGANFKRKNWLWTFSKAETSLVPRN